MSVQPIVQFIEGIDPEPRDMTTQEILSLTDWFGQWLAKTPPSQRQVTLRTLMNEALPQNSYKPFAIADGINIVYDHENEDNPLNSADRDLRFVLIVLPDNASTIGPLADLEPAIEVRTLCVVAGPNADGGATDPDAFLQCASWDPNALGKGRGMLRFYQRNKEGWLYFGNGFNAFNPLSTGRGAFDGHIGGAMIMKELTFPWTHWFDSGNLGDFTASLGSTKDSPSKADPYHALYDPLYTDDSGAPFSLLGRAEDLEPIVELSVTKWYSTRFVHDFIDPNTSKPFQNITTVVRDWVGHILLNRSMNIAAGATPSNQVNPTTGIAGVPTTLFFNNFALQRVLPDVANPGGGYNIQTGSDYIASVAELGLGLYYTDFSVDPPVLKLAVPGIEGPFPFPVIEPGVEDYQGIRTLVNFTTSSKNSAILLPKKAIAAMLMVDFYNPIYSHRRESLMAYVPASASLKADGKTYDVVDQIMAKIAGPASKDPSGPEAELFALLNTPDSDWVGVFTMRVNEYAKKVNDRLTNSDEAQRKVAVQEYMTLAEGRRRLYKGREHEKPDGSGLDEFSLTLPITMNLVPFTQMTENGDVIVMLGPALDFFKARIQKKKANALARFANMSGGCAAFVKRAAAGGCPVFGNQRKHYAC